MKTKLRREVIFSKEQISRLTRPGVYVFRKDKKDIYVGLCLTGILRPFNPKHDYVTRDDFDEVEITFCKSYNEARRLEQILIYTLKPLLNKHLKIALLPRRMKIKALKERKDLAKKKARISMREYMRKVRGSVKHYHTSS